MAVQSCMELFLIKKKCIGESLVFFSVLYFLSISSIMKVYIAVTLVRLSKFHFRKTLVPEIWSKMLLTNQFVGLFNQLQDSKTGCISQRN